ncbi:nucleotidyltransferase family protein [Dyadobacter sp. 3J3]|uniref:nucleotidyltransferase family protein n=1 Tax=Dyadobacter sp. 3J3 TaxID=2606600 RepID=UPI00135AC8DC|nr:nucleotidyltransferase domain-containing protein [Dyadobacter sp. 3J3]
MERLELYSSAIIKLCETHKVKSLYAFGSVLTDNFNSESDIDLIVDFEEIETEEYADNYFDLKFSLQHILERPIDLLEEQAIKNPYFRGSINKQRKLVYQYQTIVNVKHNLLSEN